MRTWHHRGGVLSEFFGQFKPAGKSVLETIVNFEMLKKNEKDVLTSHSAHATETQFYLIGMCVSFKPFSSR